MDNSKSQLIFITGGHATPAVACIDELRARGYSNLIYIGQKRSLLFDKNVSSEYKLITEKLNLTFKSIIAGKFSLFPNLNSIIWLLRLPIGFIQAFIWQFIYRPKLVLTFGSHVGIPVVFWAWIFRTPVIAHEQTVTIGRANKFIQKYATRVCYSWPKERLQTLDFNLETGKFVMTGNPIRNEILNSNSNSFKFADESKKIVFITGGNQGANAINEFIFANLEKILEKYNVIHQTGSNTIYKNFEKAKEFADQFNQKGIKYIPKDYIFGEEMSESYKKAFVVIGRGGANTLTELLALKKKGIIIPIATSSGNEQFLNAKLLEDIGLGIVLNQVDLENTNILEVLEKAEILQITDENKVAELSEIHKNAQKKIVDEVEMLLS